MAIKINRILIKNFKPFKNFEANFKSADFVVFDGPNGFGKTSFYDAIELLLTGRLRRYNELFEMTIHGKKNVNGCPFLNDQNSSGDLIIKGEFDINGVIVCLTRIGKRTDLIQKKNVREYNFPLYRLPQFENADYAQVTDENSYLKELLGENYKENFQFLNYIEQEENICLLKKSDKERNEQIAHLFNTSNFEIQIEKFTWAQRKIRDLCGAEARNKLSQEKQELQSYRAKLTNEIVEVPYQRLITWRKEPWDNESLEFPGEQYVEWLGEDGKLTQLELFLSNIEEFEKEWENNRIDKLLADEKLVKQLLLYWNFLDSSDEYAKRIELYNLIKKFLKICDEGILSAIQRGQSALPAQLHSILPKEVVDGYPNAIAALQVLQTNASILARLLSDMKEARNAFINKFVKYEAQNEKTKICPLCSYSWKDAEELKQKISDQTQRVEQLVKISANELNAAVGDFNKRILEPLRKWLQEYIIKNPVNEPFVTELKMAAKNQINLQRLFQQFKDAGIDLSRSFVSQPSVTEQVDLESLRAEVNHRKHVLNPERLRPYFSAFFLNVFENSFEKAYIIEKTAFVQKRKYIEYQYSLFQNNTIRKLQKKLADIQADFDSASLFKEKLDSIIKICKNSLEQYQADLIKDIEILFHIYSGRISQESQGGLGLFIESTDGRIRFLETHAKKHDAVFTMSSGQLATLIIAFTLALNKKYSKHLLLFIDDPIQTLDELNIVGFVEVLRHQFKDRQIFMSTHEDMMSTYLRYKFEKFGLKTMRVNFKEKMLLTTS